jgi:hypothetical protein
MVNSMNKIPITIGIVYFRIVLIPSTGATEIGGVIIPSASKHFLQ